LGDENKDKENKPEVVSKTESADKLSRKTIIDPVRELYKENNDKSLEYVQIWTEQKELRRMFREDKYVKD